MKKIIIAIDGYSSTGKSSFAQRIAAELGYVYIDTGALYRAVTLHAVRLGILTPDNRIDLNALLGALNNTYIAFRFNEVSQRNETYLNGENVEQEIRRLEISNQVSHIAVLPEVRAYVDERLVELGKQKGVVMDGRDIGTAVFPNAELKIFMTADPLVRAERRLKELLPKQPEATLEAVLANLQQRDIIDSSRETHPLTQAPDALILDNTHMTMEDQMEWIRSILPKYLNHESTH